MVIPTEEEAAAAGASAAAAAQAFSGVFEQALEEQRAQLSEQFADEGEPLFPSTTVDPLDLFDPLNECRWTEAAVVADTGFSLTIPSFVAVADTVDEIDTYHATYDYGRCAPISGDIQVVEGAIDPMSVVDAQVSAYRAIGELEIVSREAVNVIGSGAPGFMVEIRTGGDHHSVFLAALQNDGAVVLLTAHVLLDSWVDASPVVLDLLRGLEIT